MLRPKTKARRSRRFPAPFLRTPDAASFVGLSIRTLEKHRIYGTGPRFLKVGGRILYALCDLKAWVEGGAKNSTADRAPRRIPPIPRGTRQRAVERPDERAAKPNEGVPR